jgi:PhnB protein
MKTLSPYLMFSGNCREAMEFYQSCFGGELHLMPFADTPMAEQVPAAVRDGVLHAMLTIGTQVLMASDNGGHDDARPGNTVQLSIDCSTEEEINRLFARLSDGGRVVDLLADMFWGKFGSVTDRFGMHWLLNLSPDGDQ